MAENKQWITTLGPIVSVPQHHLGGNKATKDLLKLAELKANQRILILGCGSGKTAINIAKNYPGEVIGTDINPKAIENAKNILHKQQSKLQASLTFLIDDILNSTLQPASFDRILIESVLIMLPKENALTKVLVLLRPGGLVAINEGLCLSAVSDEMLQLQNEFHKVDIEWELPSYDQWRQNFEHNNFKIIHDSGVIAYNIKRLGVEMVLKHPFQMLGTGLRILGNAKVRAFFLKISKLMKRTRLKWGYCLWLCAPA